MNTIRSCRDWFGFNSLRFVLFTATFAITGRARSEVCRVWSESPSKRRLYCESILFEGIRCLKWPWLTLACDELLLRAWVASGRIAQNAPNPHISRVLPRTPCLKIPTVSHRNYARCRERSARLLLKAPALLRNLYYRSKCCLVYLHIVTAHS